MDAKTFYEQIAPELDPGGFKLYFTAQRLTGFELYKQFPYEDSRGMFEMMNGHQLMRYLLADQFHAIRWEIVPGTCYERAFLLPIDRTTPAYRAFEQKLYTAIADGQMSRELQWKCRYEDALIQPPRGVVDIHMGEYASGKR